MCYLNGNIGRFNLYSRKRAVLSGSSSSSTFARFEFKSEKRFENWPIRVLTKIYDTYFNSFVAY